MKENKNIEGAYLIIDELIKQGIDTFCLSPGSRSTPLVVAIASHPNANAVMHYDERGAAFFALGYGKAMHKPAPLLCTSGRAPANYYPAVIEAAEDYTPVLLITADRPPELLQTGANQSIDQKKIFGDYVRFFFELPLHMENIREEFVMTTVDQALYRSMRSPQGPVHINCPFAKPLEPDTLVSRRSMPRRPYTTYSMPIAMFQHYEELQQQIALGDGERGLIVAGKMKAPEERKAVIALAEKLQWPVFADISSGLRLGIDSELVIPHYDVLLPTLENLKKPDVILHIGGRVMSKRLLEYLKNSRPREYIVVKDTPQRLDPEHCVTQHIEAAVAPFCDTLRSKVAAGVKGDFLRGLQEASRNASQRLEEMAHHELSELTVAWQLSKNIPAGEGLFLANSLSVRHMDMFACAYGNKVEVMTNRGVSGIDGTIASACGFAEALKKPVTLLIGDLAFLHDVNSLAYIKNRDLAIRIIILNNNGGGIFSFLPIAKHEEIFKTYFEMPHHLKFKAAADLFGIAYFSPKTNDDFVECYKNEFAGIFEIETKCSDTFDKCMAMKRCCLEPV